MSTTENKRSGQERALGRRKQVLEAAAICFSRSGFHGASMAEISKAAGMSAGHIYNYFDGKDAIIAAFVEENVERVSAIMRDLAQYADPLQAMLGNIEMHVQENLDPKMWTLQLEIFAESARNPKIALLLREADTGLRTAFRAIIKKARQERQLATDDATLDGRLEAIIALFQGLSLRALHNPGLDRQAVVAAMRLAMTPLLLT